MKKKIAIGAVVFLAIMMAAVYSITRWYGKNSLLMQDGSPWLGAFHTGLEELTVEHDGIVYSYSPDIINILCIGIDREGEMNGPDYSGYSRGQADAIFLVSLDVDGQEIRLIAIPRDTMVTLQVYDLWGEYVEDRKGQIALQYAYGDGLSQSGMLMMGRVYDVLGDIPIHAYAALDLECIIPVNDAIGGVEVTMDQDYTLLDPSFVEGATLRLMGEQAVHFVRTRDTEVPGSAYTRIARQKLYMTSFIDQAKQAVKRDLTLPAALFEELQDYIVTDMNVAQITYLATEVVRYRFSEENMYVLTGEIQNNTGLEEFYPDEDALWQMKIELFYQEVEEE